MIILHIAPVNWEKISGISVAVSSLVEAQNKLDIVEAALLVTSKKNPTIPENLNFLSFSYKKYNVMKRGLNNIPIPYNSPHLAIFHSTYIPIHAFIATKLKKYNIPYIITPHGGMTHGAQKLKKLKKKIGNFLFFNKIVQNATALHCLAKGEAEEIKKWKIPIFILGNGVEIPSESFLAHPDSSNHLRLVFIGRLAIYIKGLDLLIEACAHIRSILLKKNALIELYGPDDNGSVKKLNEQIRCTQLENIIKIYDPIVGEDKKKLLREIDIFLHTSRFEGHPMAVLEALAHGLPCLLTTGTNISAKIKSAHAGWEVKPESQSIANVLKKIICNEFDLKSMGIAAYRLARREYDWQKIAEESINEYKKII